MRKVGRISLYHNGGYSRERSRVGKLIGAAGVALIALTVVSVSLNWKTTDEMRQEIAQNSSDRQCVQLEHDPRIEGNFFEAMPHCKWMLEARQQIRNGMEGKSGPADQAVRLLKAEGIR